MAARRSIAQIPWITLGSALLRLPTINRQIQSILMATLPKHVIVTRSELIPVYNKGVIVYQYGSIKFECVVCKHPAIVAYRSPEPLCWLCYRLWTSAQVDNPSRDDKNEKSTEED